MNLRPPSSAAALGALGLIPLFAAALVLAFGPPNLAGPALLTLTAYSAAVLSFLGGVRWGVEIALTRSPRWAVLAASNLAPIAAWLLVAAPGAFGLSEVQALGGFILAFLLQWAWDSRSTTPPAWYPRLRTLLTLGAVLALAVALEAMLRL